MRRTAADLNARLFGSVSGVAGALGHPTRLKIAHLLAQAEKPVEWLANHLGESVANTSAHLRVLAGVGLVAPERRGRQVFYQLTSERLLPLLVALREAADAVSPAAREEANTLAGELPQTSATGEELMGQVRRGRVALLDLRPSDEYAAGHVPGARSVPFDTLDRSLDGLPRTRPVAAYCRGPYCAMAVEGVRRLRARSFNAVRVPFGMTEWRVAGFPVETGVAAPRRFSGART